MHTTNTGKKDVEGSFLLQMIARRKVASEITLRSSATRSNTTEIIINKIIMAYKPFVQSILSTTPILADIEVMPWELLV